MGVYWHLALCGHNGCLPMIIVCNRIYMIDVNLFDRLSVFWIFSCGMNSWFVVFLINERGVLGAERS